MSDNSFEHYWKYFETHSQQRMIVFNFYLAIVGLAAAGIGVALQQGIKYNYITSSISVFLAFVSLIFFKLDQRVTTLIKRSEKALFFFERRFPEDHPKLFQSDQLDQNLNSSLTSPWSYGRCFRISFFLIGNISLLMSFVPYIVNK
ncbi:hypothetical protein SAMN03097719_3129 [Pantoea ananatis]|uniref:hypothetical protein n=1 Tax=Pantoea ananas TaxID=553 RepID=UPI00099D8BDA|nr:hypothetical protein [Pantoea ananatis]SKA77847.1 hypothetical protein SAMN03097719_3129 [Pantoea ananatis]